MNNYPELINENGKVDWTTRPRQLKVGEKVEYELINIGKSALDTTGKTLAMPERFGIKKKDTVRISYPDKAKKEMAKDGDNREVEYIEIGYQPGIRTEVIQFMKASAGVLTIIGGSSKNQEKFEFLESCNENESNPNRNTEVQARFALINNKEKARIARSIRKEKRTAANKAENLKINELYRVAIGIGYLEPDKMEEEALRDVIESYAEANPIEFLTKVENPDLVIQEIAITAKNKGFIDVNMQKRAILGSNGETLHTWSPEKDAKWPGKFVEFVKSKEGEKFYSSLKDQMKISS